MYTELLVSTRNGRPRAVSVESQRSAPGMGPLVSGVPISAWLTDMDGVLVREDRLSSRRRRGQFGTSLLTYDDGGVSVSSSVTSLSV